MSTKFHFLKSYVKVNNGCVYPRCYVKWDKDKKCFTLFGEPCKIVDEGTFEELEGMLTDEKAVQANAIKQHTKRKVQVMAYKPEHYIKFHKFAVVFKHQGIEVSIFAFSRKELAEQYCKELTEDLKPWSRIHFFVKEVE